MQTLTISPGTHHQLLTGYRDQPRISLQGIALVVAAHALALTFLATLAVVPMAPSPLSALMVEILSASAPAPAVSQPEPPAIERTPVPKRLPAAATAPKQVLSTPAEAPDSAAEPARTTTQAEPATVLPASAKTTAPATQPRFDADYLSNPAPAYPPLSRRMGEEGKVVLRVFVEPGGRAGQIELNSGSGSPRLDLAAQEAVWRWKFIPARRGDEAVGAWVLIPIVFNLKG